MSAHFIFIVLIWVAVAAFWGVIIFRHFRPKRKQRPVDDVKLVSNFLAKHGIRAVVTRPTDGGDLEIKTHPDDTQKFYDLMEQMRRKYADVS
jgi:hypothetical protein